MQLSEFTARLDDLLDHDAFADVDASSNGLQVGPGGDAEVEHVAFAVDGVEATFDAAIDAGADVCCVHHGMIWGGLERVTDVEYERIAGLVQGDLALYVSHLPLDAHPELGNAAQLAATLECERREPFGSAGGEHIGQLVRASEPFGVAELASSLDALDTGGRECRTLAFGPDTIEDIAIVTGSGTDWIREAAAVGADALVTGEGKQQAYHEAREVGLNVFLAGHYATETFGVRALESLVAEWGLETTFIDYPTGL